MSVTRSNILFLFDSQHNHHAWLLQDHKVVNTFQIMPQLKSSLVMSFLQLHALKIVVTLLQPKNYYNIIYRKGVNKSSMQTIHYIYATL